MEVITMTTVKLIKDKHESEIYDRVRVALTNTLTDKLDVTEEVFDEYCLHVMQELRKLDRIKKEHSDYNFAQSLLSYRVDNPKADSGLIQDLYSKGTYTITLDKDEHKSFMECVNPKSESNQTWTLQKGSTDKNCSFSRNYGEKK